MNRRFLLVASREYVENLRTKTFWIGILAFPVLLTLSVAVPAWLEKAKDIRPYAVVDQSGWLLSAIDERATYDDTLRLLRLIQEKAKAGGPAFEKMPEALRQLVPLVEGRTEDELTSLAKTLAVMGESMAGESRSFSELPAELRAEAERQSREFIAWQLALTPEDARALGAGIRRGDYRRETIPAGTADAEAWARTQLDAGDLFAYFVIPADPLGEADAKYVSNNRTDRDLKDWVERLADDEIRARRFAKEGVAPDVARRIQQEFEFAEKQTTAAGEREVEETDVLRQWAPVVFVYILWLSVFTTAQMLLTNTVEEKSNRVIEVLLSSVSALELLSGKVAGIAATGLTVIGSWIGFFFLVLKYLPKFLGAPLSIDFSVILREPTFLAAFVVYFLLGYLLYATMLVGLGSVTNSLKEAQNLMQPLVVLLIVPLLAMVPVGKDPNGALAQALSWIPLFTPFVMMNRAAGPPAAWEYVGTTIVLLATIVFSSWAAAKIFRIGILMTGKPPRIGEMLRWLKAPTGLAPEQKD